MRNVWIMAADPERIGLLRGKPLVGHKWVRAPHPLA